MLSHSPHLDHATFSWVQWLQLVVNVSWLQEQSWSIWDLNPFAHNTVSHAPRLRVVWCRLLLLMLLGQGRHLLVPMDLGVLDWGMPSLPHNSRVRTQHRAICRQLSHHFCYFVYCASYCWCCWSRASILWSFEFLLPMRAAKSLFVWAILTAEFPHCSITAESAHSMKPSAINSHPSCYINCCLTCQKELHYLQSCAIRDCAKASR